MNLNILNRLLNPWHKKPRCECLTALLIPKLLTGVHLDPQRVLQASAQFRSPLEAAVTQVYGTHEARTYGPDDAGIIGSIFQADDVIVTYYLTPSSPNSSLGQCYTGTLDLRQEQLNMKQAGSLLQDLLVHSFLAYNHEDPNQPSFMIFLDAIYPDDTHTTTAKGISLLCRLGVHPIEACTYRRASEGTCWVQLTPPSPL